MSNNQELTAAKPFVYDGLFLEIIVIVSDQNVAEREQLVAYDKFHDTFLGELLWDIHAVRRRRPNLFYCIYIRL